jgi:hypothetical protein
MKTISEMMTVVDPGGVVLMLMPELLRLAMVCPCFLAYRTDADARITPAS